MLWNGGPHPSLILGTSNVGSTYNDDGLGTQVTTGTANTKGSNTNLINGLAATAYGLSVFICGTSSSGVNRRLMVDILIDYGAGVGNAGSSWSVLIANLYVVCPTFGSAGASGCSFYFPIIIPQGAALGAAAQSNQTTLTPRVTLSLPTYNSRPEGLVYGTQVQTLGATTGSTTGVSVTPGTNAKGSYSASLGTLNRNSFYFQMGIGTADTSMTANGYLFDLAAGPSQEKMCIFDMAYGVAGAAEQAYKFWQYLAQRVIPAGSNIYVRGAGCGGAPDSSMDVVGYAVS
jgi:hypothetical protein